MVGGRGAHNEICFFSDWYQKGERCFTTTHISPFLVSLQPGCRPLFSLGWPSTPAASGGSRSVGKGWAAVTMTTTSLGTGRPKQYAFTWPAYCWYRYNKKTIMPEKCLPHCFLSMCSNNFFLNDLSRFSFLVFIFSLLFISFVSLHFRGGMNVIRFVCRQLSDFLSAV